MTATDCSAIYGRRLVTSVGWIGCDAVDRACGPICAGILGLPSRADLPQPLRKAKAPPVGRGSAKLPVGTLPFKQLIITPHNSSPATLRCISIDIRTHVINA